MWCLAPAWPEHARHVAVEFVHPVIVGKRALPAVSVVDPDPVAALRATVRAGDVLVGVSTADAPGVASGDAASRRVGLTSVWIGAGLRPPPGAADHVLWIDDRGRDRCLRRRLVLRYHLLWELTHVCFEHPGLLTIEHDGPACDAGSGLHHLLRRGAAGRGRGGRRDTAEVRTAGGSETSTPRSSGRCTPATSLLVHAGTAIVVLEEIGQRCLGGD